MNVMKKLLFLNFILLFSMVSYGQLDSAKIEKQFTYVNIPGDSLNSGDMLQVKVWVNDYDFLGQVIIDVIDVESDFPLVKIKKTKAELLLTKEANTNWSIINVAVLDQTRSYTIKATVQNYQNYALPEIVVVHNGTN